MTHKQYYEIAGIQKFAARRINQQLSKEGQGGK